MAQVFANNAFSYLTADVAPTAQDITIRSADAALFPQPDQAKGETFMVTLEDRARNRMEITECFRRVGATLSIRRARENTTPETFPAGAIVSNRLTAGVIQGGLLGWAEFNRRYLGAYATQPTLDPLGFPLQRGAIMYDLNTDALFVFTIDGWVKWSPSGDLQTGIPPGGRAGDVLTRTAEGLIAWGPSSDLAARDAAQAANATATQALTTANSAVTSANNRVSRAGDTMTGPLQLSPGADTAGNAAALLVMNTRGNGSAYLRHTKAGASFADLILTDQGTVRYHRYSSNGTLLQGRAVLLENDALSVSGGTVNGPVTLGVSATLTVGGAFRASSTAALGNTTLLPTGGEGGNLFFSPNPGGRGMTLDLADSHLRFFRDDNAMLASMNLNSGQFNVNNLLSAAAMNSNGDIVAGGAMRSNWFRFNEVGGDTGMDSGGDGYGTLISNGAPVLQFQPGGNVYVWGNITAFSDRRMKEDIGIIEDPLELVRRMVGVTFVKKGDETRRRQVGFIAQDVEDVLPDLIQHSQDGMMGVNYAAYVSVLNEAIKVLAGRLEALEAARA